MAQVVGPCYSVGHLDWVPSTYLRLRLSTLMVAGIWGVNRYELSHMLSFSCSCSIFLSQIIFWNSMYLKDWVTERERKGGGRGETDYPPSTDSLPELPQLPRLDKARSLELKSGLSSWGPGSRFLGYIFSCFPRCISREPDKNQRSQDSKQPSDMGGQWRNGQLNPSPKEKLKKIIILLNIHFKFPIRFT